MLAAAVSRSQLMLFAGSRSLVRMETRSVASHRVVSEVVSGNKAGLGASDTFGMAASSNYSDASPSIARLQSPERSAPRKSPKHKRRQDLPVVLPPPTLPCADSGAWANCALLVDKPVGWTSHDVCAKLKSALGVRKIGHAGTLDKLATGLLVVCVGLGTKAVETFMAEEKVYTGVMRLGAATPTYDAEMPVCEEAPWEHVTEEMVQIAAREQFTGEAVMQVPPMYSAIRVDGQRLYKSAREGLEVVRPARPVRVADFRLERVKATAPGAGVAGVEPDFHYLVRCGKGTYVRSLVHDLGKAVGSCAHVRELRRDSSGGFHVRHAWSLEALVAAADDLDLRARGRTRRGRRRVEGRPVADQAEKQGSDVPACG